MGYLTMDLNENNFNDTAYSNEENKNISFILTEKLGERASFFVGIMQRCRTAIINDIGNMATLNVLELSSLLERAAPFDNIELTLCLKLIEDKFGFESFSSEDIEGYEISILASLVQDEVIQNI